MIPKDPVDIRQGANLLLYQTCLYIYHIILLMEFKYCRIILYFILIENYIPTNTNKPGKKANLVIIYYI